MKSSVKEKYIAGWLGLALMLMGIVSITSYQNVANLLESANKVKHTHEVLQYLTDVFATLTDAESGRRGYFLYKNEEELKRYNIAIQSIDPKIKRLRQLISDNPSQKHQLTVLESLLSQRIALFKQSINLAQKGNLLVSSQAPLIAQSREQQMRIRQVIAEMQSQEKQILERRISNYQFSVYYGNLIKIFCTFLSFGIIVVVYVLLYQQWLKRQRAENIQRALTREKELSELKLCFLSMISHEFRTPLTIILGSAQLLAESNQQWSKSKKDQNLHRIQSSAKLMSRLLTDILILEGAEAGKLECRLELVDIEAFCLNVVEDIQFFSGTEHSISFVSQAQCTHALLDKKLLYSIVSNLLLNSIKYSSQGGNINFILSCELEAVIFQIKDEGIGIPLEDQQRLYEPFYRGKNVENAVGTGLGLAVVKTCVDLHQGQIFVESVVKVGTTFTVKIPKKASIGTK